MTLAALALAGLLLLPAYLAAGRAVARRSLPSWWARAERAWPDGKYGYTPEDAAARRRKMVRDDVRLAMLAWPLLLAACAATATTCRANQRIDRFAASHQPADPAALQRRNNQLEQEMGDDLEQELRNYLDP